MPPLSIDFEADNMVGPFLTMPCLIHRPVIALSTVHCLVKRLWNVSVVNVTGVSLLYLNLMNYISNMWFIEPRKYLVVSSNHRKVEKYLFIQANKRLAATCCQAKKGGICFS